ncbi:MAG: histidine phosphatase family protein [Campylobacterota bacterium]|nr:histidine phosphatase family protein [Campylobacterota bacterium]
MTVTLLRHCAVIEKYDGCYNGHIDIPLSNSGVTHAKSLAKEFGEFNFDALFCSDLKRAKETLVALYPQETHLHVNYSKALREKSWGVHEGLNFEQINRTIAYENFSQWLNALDGESIELFTKRITDFFFIELPKHNANHALIVTHAGVIKTLLSITKNISLQESFATPFDYGTYVTMEL